MNGVMKIAICEQLYMELFFNSPFYMVFISYFIFLYFLGQILNWPLTYIFLFVYCFYEFSLFYKRVVQNNKGWVNEILMNISKRKSQFLDDPLPGFNSLGARKGIYSSERNDVEKQTTKRQRKTLSRSICKLNWISSR